MKQTVKFTYQELFGKIDTDGSGFIEFNEFIHILDHCIMSRSLLRGQSVHRSKAIVEKTVKYFTCIKYKVQLLQQQQRKPD